MQAEASDSPTYLREKNYYLTKEEDYDHLLGSGLISFRERGNWERLHEYEKPLEAFPPTTSSLGWKFCM